MSTVGSECLREGLLVLLMASTINRVLRHYDSLNVKIKIETFLGYLKSIIRSYKEVFNRPLDADIINSKESLAGVIDRNDFKYFVKLQGNTLHIDASIENYPELMKSLVVEASRRYSMFLVKNVNDLAKLYTNLIPQDVSMDVDKEEESAVEQVDEVAEAGSPEKPETKETTKESEKESEKESGKSSESESEEESEKSESEESEADTTKKSPETVKETKDKNKESEKDESDLEESDLESEEESDKESEKDTKEPEPKKPLTRRDRKAAKTEAEEEAKSEKSKDKVVKEEQEKEETKDESQEEDKEDEATPRRSTRKRSMSPAVTNPNKRFQSIGINLINNIQSHRFSSVFLQPVNKKEVPDYYEVVNEPKDLKNIMKTIKLKSGEPVYTLLQDLERDVMLMFANCIMFNHSDEDLVNLARTMRDDVINTFKIFREAEL